MMTITYVRFLICLLMDITSFFLISHFCKSRTISKDSRRTSYQNNIIEAIVVKGTRSLANLAFAKITESSVLLNPP